MQNIQLLPCKDQKYDLKIKFATITRLESNFSIVEQEVFQPVSIPKAPQPTQTKTNKDRDVETNEPTIQATDVEKSSSEPSVTIKKSPAVHHKPVTQSPKIKSEVPKDGKEENPNMISFLLHPRILV